MAHNPGGKDNPRKDKKNKDRLTPEQRAQKIARSQRANVRTGGAAGFGGGFGLSGAGRNRAALRDFGSAQAIGAVSRPLTSLERAFGANPFVPEPVRSTFDFGQTPRAASLEGPTSRGIGNLGQRRPLQTVTGVGVDNLG